MQDWNVIVTARDYRAARGCLAAFGEVARTDFFNGLTMKVPDVERFVEELREAVSRDPVLAQALARVVPVTQRFTFQSPAEFEAGARDMVAAWVDDLAGCAFHVRMHRRGFRGRLSSQDEERFLDRFLLKRLAEQGAPGRITFDDPDVIIAVETVGQQAGLSLWGREARARYPFLGLD
jgi:tRNA(Ser,Leu) C12 N-acetylase TAN1